MTARIITEPRAVSQSFHPAPLAPTEAHWLDDPPDPSSKDTTGQHAMDDALLSCKQRFGPGLIGYWSGLTSVVHQKLHAYVAMVL